MKNIKISSVLFLLFLSIQIPVIGQSCYPNGISLITQANVDNFLITNPNCTIVQGDVCIGNCPPNITFTDNPTNLNGLSNLTEIEGSLHLFQTYTLVDLQGLQNLRTIGGDLIIESSHQLLDLRGLENLQSIGGNLIIHNNNNFKGVQGLDNLTTLGGELNFYENPKQTKFGIESLSAIGGRLRLNELDSLNFAGFENLLSIGRSLVISNNPNVTSLTGLDNLETVGLDFIIDDNYSLSDLTGLGNLNSINQDFVVQNQRLAFSLSGLNSLTSIGRDLKLLVNNEILDCTGLEGITKVNRDLILERNAFQSLNGLQNLKEIERDFLLEGHWQLTNFNGIENLETVGRNITIKSNSSLLDLTGLNQLRLVGENLTLENNGFTSLTGLMTPLNIIKSLFIWDHDDLPNLTGLEMVSSVGKGIGLKENNGLVALNGIAHLINDQIWLDLVENGSLRNLSGLEAVDSIGILQIKENRNLDSLTGLDNLKSISNALVIDRNRELFSLTGLENLNSIGTFFLGNVITFSATGNNVSDLSALSNLRKVSGDIKIERNVELTNLIGLEGIDTIGGSFSMIENQKLDSNLALVNLKVINGDVEVIDNPSLLSFEGLSQLTAINGNVEIDGNQSLGTLEHLSNLESIRGGLALENNASLRNLNGLEKLNLITGELVINENDKLADIYGIQNINPDSLTRLVIRRNGKLSVCNLDNICTYLNLDNNDVLISSNKEGCKSTLQIYCEDYSISGHVYHDVNQNGQRDSAEVGLEDIMVFINNPSRAFTNPEGLFFITGEEDSLYTIVSNPDSNWTQVSLPPSYSITYQQGNPANNELDFGLYPTYITNTCLPGGIEFISQEMIDEFPLRYPWCTEIEGDVEIREELDSTIFNLLPLSQLNIIRGDLFVTSNLGLTNLNGLNQIDTIEGLLSVGSNDQLENVNGLESLKVIDGVLRIEGNPKLESIAGIRNINPSTIDNIFGGLDLRITNNPSLSMCDLENICQLTFTPDKMLQIGNNAPGCNEIAELMCDDLRLAGTTFYDFNQNKIKDPNEGGLSNITVNINPPNTDILTNQDGGYYAFGDSGTTYTITPEILPDWNLTTDSSSFTVSLEPNTVSNLEKDFGYYPSFSRHEGLVNLSSHGLRCNTPVDFFLRFQNTGTFQETGQIRLVYDSLCTFESAFPFPDQVDEDNYLLTWNYDQYPFQYEDFRIQLNMPDFNSLGEILHFNAAMYRDSSNTSVLLKDYDYAAQVICSYDPNDKLVNPPGVQDENYTLRGETLTYTVRFQNTGNAEAIDVRIIDTLDAGLDLSTFKVLNSSHSLRTTMEGPYITFLFRNIYLPDSTSNPEGSQGFVSYEIKQLPTNPDPTEINNTAHIIFDFNPAIITNTTQNTMVEMIPVIVSTSEVTQQPIYIRPNPATQFIEIYTKGNSPIQKIEIYDLSGRQVQQEQNKRVNISRLPAGLYLIKAEVGGQILVGKFVKG